MARLVLVAFGFIISGFNIAPAQAFPAISPGIKLPPYMEPVQWRHGGGGVYPDIVGGVLTQPQYGPYRAPYYGTRYRQYTPSLAYEGGSHVSWCYGRYRTYRAFDNTYQPYYGPRRQCVGPY
ncbi:BA14K family protein [Rhizobium cauense]|uniref:BA14K family protein n=1 Tax=Rhizobium cauense TaxID=1166683 RepID=UPI001C6E4446|nr:BA14K family protein [Rhizobium cauense]MBW9114712.1 BA14K family protein [Rhizobium cauense]